ncbi:MAG: hypothetical protein H7A44_06950 [Opitutaceae bacterium]|nr:hypothetical protein [Opitutaceae bacterium]
MVAVVVMIGAYSLEIALREVHFHRIRIKAPNPQEFVAWFNHQEKRCTAEETAEFNKAVGIIYANVGTTNPSIRKVPGADRSALCKEIDGQIVADVIIRSYKLANEQLVLFITRQQNDVLRIMASAGVNEMVTHKQQVIKEAQAQLAKNKERIAVMQQLGKL